jgi:hypothetical protein
LMTFRAILTDSPERIVKRSTLDQSALVRIQVRQRLLIFRKSIARREPLYRKVVSVCTGWSSMVFGETGHEETDRKRLSLRRIEEVARRIDPVFLGSPQYEAEALRDELGLRLVCKVETANPILSFKGRGTDYLLHRLEGRGRAAGLCFGGQLRPRSGLCGEEAQCAPDGVRRRECQPCQGGKNATAWCRGSPGGQGL